MRFCIGMKDQYESAYKVYILRYKRIHLDLSWLTSSWKDRKTSSYKYPQ
uniref:Uncharacterized protein n=1 Tax=Tetranychus urticae TaxID=32264 RepID=T1KDJ2_TETUR